MYTRSDIGHHYDVNDHLDISVDGSISSLEGSSLANEGRMKRKLRYFFMNPCQKYRTKKRIPFKFTLQVVKIALVTFQLIMFGLDEQRHIGFVEKNLNTFRHLYLRNWDTTLETMPYPPTRGPFAVYTYEDLFKAVDHLLERYNRTLTLALGSYDFVSQPPPPVLMCRSYYKVGEIFAGNQSYNFNDFIIHNCKHVTAVNVDGKETYNFEAFLQQNDITMNFDSINRVSFHFSLKSVSLRSIDLDQKPDCYQFNITITFDNQDHNGEVAIKLRTYIKNIEPCKGRIIHPSITGYVIRIMLTLFDVLVTIVCVLSLSLCIRSLNNATRMRSLAIKYFYEYHSHTLCKDDRQAFIDGWLILIIISDILVIMGSLIKLLTDNSLTDNFQLGGASLGIGVCFVWCGLLRYLGFFGKYNILLRVLHVAMPSLLRFLVCVGVLFSGFTLCGWVVIGPYHVKFKTIESTIACLFSLLNGDDMYVTFSGVEKSTSLFCYYFNYVYLLIFISLFIYAVLNVFITIIIDAYEVMKEGNNAEPSTFMWDFIGQRNEPPRNTRLYRLDEEDEAGCNIARICSNFCHRICCCCPHSHLNDDDDTDMDGEVNVLSDNVIAQSNSRRNDVNERTALLSNSESVTT